MATSPLPPRPLSTDTTTWHIPGPSSKFHTRSRPQLGHSRTHSTYTPRAPALNTAARAEHRRTLSQVDSVVRSPVRRFTPYRCAMAQPVTPAKHTGRSFSGLHDSPFSDYFTDEDARSVLGNGQMGPPTQEVLVRMNKLQSQLMREDEGDAEQVTGIVARKLAEMENEIASLHSQSREQAEAYLFTDDEDIARKQRKTPKSRPQSREERAEDRSPCWGYDPQHSELLNSAQSALRALTHAQEELKARHAELVALNSKLSANLEEKDMQVDALRTENKALKSDLGFDHTELLFLELQMRKLELAPVREEMRTERLDSVMEAWRSDWSDVESRFSTRRRKYGVSTPRRGSAKIVRDEDEVDSGDWHIEVQKQGSQRVGSLTLKRVSELITGSGDEDATDAEDTTLIEVESHAEISHVDPIVAQLDGPASSIYISRSTQTTAPPSIGRHDQSVHEENVASGTGEIERGDADHNDGSLSSSVKIEMSASDPASGSRPRRTPLQELWQSLSELAGVEQEDY